MTRRVLVLSGGGANGAWQVGVVRHLLQTEGRRYSGMVGVSVGALNAAFLAQYPEAEQGAAYERLSSIWDTIEPRRIYKRWFPFGRLHGLWRSSIYDSGPLRRLVLDNLDPERVRRSDVALKVGTVRLETGDYVSIDKTHAHLPDGVYASAAFPVAFTPGRLTPDRRGPESGLWTDGGVREVTPLGDAIELGATEVDVVTCSPKRPGVYIRSKPNALDLGMRVLMLMADEIIQNDLRVAASLNMVAENVADSGYAYVKIRTFQPASDLGDMLDFSPQRIGELRALGESEAPDVAHVVEGPTSRRPA